METLPRLMAGRSKFFHDEYTALDTNSNSWSGEAVEDLTGGITTELFTTDIIDKELFWNKGLRQVNRDFLFSCSIGHSQYDSRKGLVFGHAYAIMDAVEHTRDGKLYRLVKVRNPWGQSEWSGPWSDGSNEWDGYWMDTLKHKFGDDGVFWISYEDLIKNFQDFDRTRLFDDRWKVTQQWTGISVPWTLEYLDTKFKLEVAKPGPTVIVLSQLDDRYFCGLRGQYNYTLQFRLHKGNEEDYAIRSQANCRLRRSICAEADLEPGTYYIVMRIEATRNQRKKSPEKVIPAKCVDRRDKLLAIGLSYDLAHAKGRFKESEAEKRRREKKELQENAKKQFKKAKERERRSRLKQKVKEKRGLAKVAEKQHKLDELMNETRSPAEPPPADAERERQMSADARSESQISTDADSEAGAEADDELAIRPKVDRLLSKTKYDMIQTEEGSGSANSPKDTRTTSTQTTLPVPTAEHASDSAGGKQTQPVPPVDPAMAATTAAATAATAAATAATAAATTTTEIAAAIAAGAYPPAPPPSPSPAEILLKDGFPIKRATLDNISDDEASWDSELDYPSSLLEESDDDDDEEEEEEEGEEEDLAAMLDCLRPPPPPKEGATKDIGNLLDDPWNAVCVVGLRVFTMGTAGEGVKVQVVKPGETEAEKKVDVDDAAADAIKGLEISEATKG